MYLDKFIKSKIKGSWEAIQSSLGRENNIILLEECQVVTCVSFRLLVAYYKMLGLGLGYPL